MTAIYLDYKTTGTNLVVRQKLAVFDDFSEFFQTNMDQKKEGGGGASVVASAPLYTPLVVQLFERKEFLVIMRAQKRALLKPLKHHYTMASTG